MSTPVPDGGGAPGDDILVRARGLVKTFGRGPDAFTAVRGVDFDVRTGEAFGFLGPNGAGKTSVMRMLGCSSPLSGGELEVFGLDARHHGATIRAGLGVVAQENHADLDLTVAQNLLIYGRYYGLSRAELAGRIDELLDWAQLSDRRDAKVEPLSGGMKRRMVIARALINRPRLILLDEPTTGLDPQARQVLWDRLWTLKSQGVSLVVTTHYMDEAEQLCDRLVIMDQGVIVDRGSPAELIARHCRREMAELRFAGPDDLACAARIAADLDLRTEVVQDRLLVPADDGDAFVAAFDRRWPPDRDRPRSVLVRRSTLEDVFLALTGRSLDGS